MIFLSLQYMRYNCDFPKLPGVCVFFSALKYFFHGLWIAFGYISILWEICENFRTHWLQFLRKLNETCHFWQSWNNFESYEESVLIFRQSWKKFEYYEESVVIFVCLQYIFHWLKKLMVFHSFLFLILQNRICVFHHWIL